MRTRVQSSMPLKIVERLEGDELFIQTCRDILEHGVWDTDQNVRPKWEDGTPITAHDFVESAKRLLNPVAGNHRADSLYEGNMIVMGAEAYFKAGKSVVEDNSLTGKYVYDDQGNFTYDGNWSAGYKNKRTPKSYWK